MQDNPCLYHVEADEGALHSTLERLGACCSLSGKSMRSKTYVVSCASICQRSEIADAIFRWTKIRSFFKIAFITFSSMKQIFLRVVQNRQNKTDENYDIFNYCH